MANNKVLRIFKKLSKKEIKLLNKFVRSPIYNQHKDVVLLFDFFRKKIESSSEEPSSEVIFEAVYPNKPYEAQQLHYVNSYLLKVIEQFLAWHEWQEDDEAPKRYLLRAYRKKRLDAQFERTFSKLQKGQENQAFRNRDFYLSEYQLLSEKVMADAGKRSANLPLQELSNAQDLSYIVEKLYNACTILTHQAVVKKEYETGLLQPMLDYLHESDLLKVPAVAIYYYSYRMLSSARDKDDFRELKLLLKSSKNAFLPSELRDHYIIAINYCARQINKGDREFLREAFELYQNGLEAEVFLENGWLSRWTYKNIVVSGLQLKEFDWVKGFINDYAEKLPIKIREGNRNLNLAYYYYETKDFDQAMVLLNQTDNDDVLHNLFSKMLLVKMFYEQSSTGALDNLLLSFKAYIMRKKGLGYHKTNYLNFIRYTKRLMKVNFYDKEALEKLSLKITEERYLVERGWLLEQIKILKK